MDVYLYIVCQIDVSNICKKLPPGVVGQESSDIYLLGVSWLSVSAACPVQSAAKFSKCGAVQNTNPSPDTQNQKPKSKNAEIESKICQKQKPQIQNPKPKSQSPNKKRNKSKSQKCGAVQGNTLPSFPHYLPMLCRWISTGTS